jgi:hypothetical protein
MVLNQDQLPAAIQTAAGRHGRRDIADLGADAVFAKKAPELKAPILIGARGTAVPANIDLLLQVAKRRTRCKIEAQQPGPADRRLAVPEAIPDDAAFQREKQSKCQRRH